MARKVKKRCMTLTLTVEVPTDVGESEVENAINESLDENGWRANDWGDWIVGAVKVTKVKLITTNEEEG